MQFQQDWPLKDVIGINSLHSVEFEVDLFHLDAGRLFTEEELKIGASRILLPRLFAEANGLQLGDTLLLEYNILPIGMSLLEVMANRPSNDDMLFHRSVPFEIIGLFEIDYESLLIDGHSIFSIVDLFNSAFIPHVLLEDLALSGLCAQQEWSEWLLNKGLDVFVPTEDEVVFLRATFVLYDMRDFDTFEQAANNILPDGWKIEGTNTSFAPIIASMDSMMVNADVIFWLVSLAVGFILILMIIFLVRERRHEIGIYLALGEKKRNLFAQLLIELGVVIIAGLTISLVLSEGFSEHFSRNMFKSEMMYQIDQLPSSPFALFPNSVDLEFSRTTPLSIGEVMEIYDVSLSMETIGFVVVVGFLIVLLSIMISMFHLLRMKTIDILSNQ